jgi:hypothetical protein
MSLIGYSSLEDAWGVKPATKRSRRAKKKMAIAQQAPERPGGVAPPDMVDPICDLYDAKFRRKRRTRGAGYDPWDSRASIHHPFSMISDASEKMAVEKEFGDLGDGEDDYEDVEPFDAPSIAEKAEPSKNRVEHTAKPARKEARRQHENHDLFMFVFSGVLLLFVLEQFIQVGLHIGVRNIDFDIE